MPKETIARDTSTGTAGTMNSELSVVWGRDSQSIQVALDRGIVGGKYTTLFSDVLTRNEVNKMIRVLRRARDAAYGSDA